LNFLFILPILHFKKLVTDIVTNLHPKSNRFFQIPKFSDKIFSSCCGYQIITLRRRNFCALQKMTDCHTSDIGHWFAMTPL